MAADYEHLYAKNFRKICELEGLSFEFSEFNTRKYRDNYDRIVGEILKSNPIEDNKNYRILKYDEIIYRAIIIVKHLLGDAVSSKELMDAASIVTKSNSENVMEGYCLDITEETEEKKFEHHNYLVIPGMNKTASVVCLVHELMHYFERKERVVTFTNYRYNETMSQIGEAVSSYLLDKDGLEYNLLYKIRGLRLDAIKFQQEALIMTEEQLEHFPMIKNDPEFADLDAYERSRDHAYLVGFINQVILLNRYLDDEKTFLKKLNEIYKGSLKVPDLVNYYGIDIKKREITEEVLEVVKRYK